MTPVELAKVELANVENCRWYMHMNMNMCKDMDWDKDQINLI